MAGAMEKIKAKVENVLHKDKDTTATHDTTHTGTSGTHAGTTGTHTGTTGTTGTHTGSSLPGSTHNDPTGPHSSHTANAADPRVDSDRYGGAGNTSGAGGYGTTGTHNTTGSGLTGSNTHGTTGHSDPTGPHDSKMANKADPRVDSDRVGPAGNSSSVGGYGNEHHSAGQQTYQTDAGLSHAHPSTGVAGGNHGTSHTQGSDPTGPHDSRIGNKADPRVDSDRYGGAGNTTGAGGYGSTGSGLTGGAPHTGTHTGTHNTTGSGLTGNQGYSDPSGPHSSHLGNQADPRVDSDRYGGAGNTTGAGGYGTTGSGLTGSHGTHGTTGSGLTGSQGYSDPTGPHDSRLGNQADPRVDSDRYGGAGNTHGTHQSTGLTGTNHPGEVGNSKAGKTAGPHGSDMMNKVDPRVDSDLNGSKTVGGDRTYG